MRVLVFRKLSKESVFKGRVLVIRLKIVEI